jgi:pyruvyltransferase
MRHIKLYWWRDASGTNFGDDVSPIIVERISGRPVEYASLESCDMIGVGSLIDRALMRAWKRTLRRPFSKIRVWGSGSLGDISPRHGLDIVAVRGPATRSAVT